MKLMALDGQTFEVFVSAGDAGLVWVDPERRWTRNLHHCTHAAAQRIGQQLRLALDQDADTRGIGPTRTGLTPIDLTPPTWAQAPPDDTWKRTG